MRNRKTRWVDSHVFFMGYVLHWMQNKRDWISGQMTWPWHPSGTLSHLTPCGVERDTNRQVFRFPANCCGQMKLGCQSLNPSLQLLPRPLNYRMRCPSTSHQNGTKCPKQCSVFHLDQPAAMLKKIAYLDLWLIFYIRMWAYLISKLTTSKLMSNNSSPTIHITFQAQIYMKTTWCTTRLFRGWTRKWYVWFIHYFYAN